MCLGVWSCFGALVAPRPLVHVNSGGYPPETYRSYYNKCVFVGLTLVMCVLYLPDNVMNRLWFSRKKEGRCSTLIKQSHVIGEMAPCRRSCFLRLTEAECDKSSAISGGLREGFGGLGMNILRSTTFAVPTIEKYGSFAPSSSLQT